jgi:endonuclease G
MPSQDVLADLFAGDPVARLRNVARDRAVANILFDPVARDGADEAAVEKALKTATEAAKKLAAGGQNMTLTEAEKDALDLFILLVARPAIFVRNGKVAERPANWPEVKRDEGLLPRIIAGVGRIETAARDGAGTGFIVGEKRILTNNHVLCSLFGVPLATWSTSPAHFAKLCTAHSKSWTNQTATEAPHFELRGEFGSTESTVVRIKSILGHHLEVDMAVLELDEDPPGSRRLPLMTQEPSQFLYRRVYVVGYPMSDVFKVTPIPIFNRVFGSDPAALGRKRFSPGIISAWAGANDFSHDASTLAGSSGSAIVDFEHRRVVGLHYRGTYNVENRAVPLWKFRNDPVLVGNGVQF